MRERKDPKLMAEIISFINYYFDTYHCTPSVREIAKNVTLEKSAVQSYLSSMKSLGVVDFDGRTIMTDYIQCFFSEYTRAAIVGTTPCGPLEMEEENIEEYVNLPTSIFGKGELYILHAKGDSMTGAGIDDGDLLVVRKQEYANNGNIVIAYIEGEGNTCKRYVLDEKTLQVKLHPENDAYEDILAENIKIQGVVVSTIKINESRKMNETWVPEERTRRRTETPDAEETEEDSDLPF